MDNKKKCDICGRLFKVSEYESLCDSYSHIRINVQRMGYTLKQCDLTTCPDCALNLFWKVQVMKRDAWSPCEVCDHDHGPKHPEYRKHCENCSQYSNFQLKKRLSERETYEWQRYNGEV